MADFTVGPGKLIIHRLLITPGVVLVHYESVKIQLMFVCQRSLRITIKPDVVYCVHGIVEIAGHHGDRGTKRSCLLW